MDFFFRNYGLGCWNFAKIRGHLAWKCLKIFMYLFPEMSHCAMERVPVCHLGHACAGNCQPLYNEHNNNGNLQGIIGRTFLAPSSVANPGSNHSRGATKLRLGKPKSAKCKCCRFCLYIRLLSWTTGCWDLKKKKRTHKFARSLQCNRKTGLTSHDTL